MTTQIKLSEILSKPVARDPLGVDYAFPAAGLADLLLFTDGAGTAVSNSVTGRPAGVIEHPVATNNAFQWLTGGGVQIEGTEIASLPAFDASAAWTLVHVGTLVGSTGGTASERIGAILGFREFGVAPLRGFILSVRAGGNDWSLPSASPVIQARMMNNGALGTIEQLAPNPGIDGLLRQRRITIISHDGAGNIACALYRGDGSVVSSDAVYTQHPIAQMFLNGGVTLTTLTPCAGASSATYAGGRQQVEAFGRYDRVLTAADIAQIGVAAARLCEKRGRYW